MKKINNYNGLEYDDIECSPDKRKKILLLSDDLRMNSGVSTISRELVLGTIHKYNWCQGSGAVQHPEKGKIVNLDAATVQMTGVEGAKVSLYPIDGYGDESFLYAIMDREKPDLIMIFTDPRFWGFFFALERQIRSKVPVSYLNIWDGTPFPSYNHSAYESVDLLMSISKQTFNINKWVLRPNKCFTMDGVFDEKGKLVPFEKTNL